MRERTFKRGDKVVSTETPAAATRLLAQGWREVEVPTERPEPFGSGGVLPPGLQQVTNDTGSDEPVDAPTPRRSRRRDTTAEPPPPEGLADQHTAKPGQSE